MYVCRQYFAQLEYDEGQTLTAMWIQWSVTFQTMPATD